MVHLVLKIVKEPHCIIQRISFIIIGNMNKVQYRKDHLVELLYEKGEISIASIAELYAISFPTVRRLCAQLKNEGRVIRMHGGIRPLQAKKGGYKFEIIDTEYAHEKAAIANFAISLVKNRQSIFIESGTTIKQFALALAERLRAGELSDVVIFTNSMVNLEILQSVCKVIVIGGLYRPERRDFCGFLGEKLIRSLRFDMCFIGADGISLESGVMALDTETAHLDELLIKNAEKSILLINSEKFSKNSLIPYCSIKDIQLIVTDSRLPQTMRDDYLAAGVNVVCVNP
jgi:DeoR/GlpR family transcriptional regulator of sugar metabolism